MIDLSEYETTPDEYMEIERDRIIEIINKATMYAGTNNNGIDRKQILKQIKNDK